MTSWFLLGVQAILGGASLHLLWWRVLPGLVRAKQPQLIIDVWLPVALVLPFIVLAIDVGHDVKEGGWTPLAGTILCAIFGAGVALMAGPGRFDAFGESTLLHEDESGGVLWSVRVRVIGTGILAGVVLLMLGAAHIMTIWIGQAALALAAILLWINTPDDSPRGAGEGSEVAMTVGMIAVVLLAVGQAVPAMLVDAEARVLSSLLMLAHACAAIGFSALRIGPGIAARLGMWTAGLGVLASLGVLSVSQMLPRVLVATRDADLEAAPPQIAYGFGAFAFEATMLLVLGPALIVMSRLERPLNQLLGLAVVSGAAVLITIRLGFASL